MIELSYLILISQLVNFFPSIFLYALEFSKFTIIYLFNKYYLADVIMALGLQQ